MQSLVIQNENLYGEGCLLARLVGWTATVQPSTGHRLQDAARGASSLTSCPPMANRQQPCPAGACGGAYAELGLIYYIEQSVSRLQPSTLVNAAQAGFRMGADANDSYPAPPPQLSFNVAGWQRSLHRRAVTTSMEPSARDLKTVRAAITTGAMTAERVDAGHFDHLDVTSSGVDQSRDAAAAMLCAPLMADSGVALAAAAARGGAAWEGYVEASGRRLVPPLQHHALMDCTVERLMAPAPPCSDNHLHPSLSLEPATQSTEAGYDTGCLEMAAPGVTGGPMYGAVAAVSTPGLVSPLRDVPANHGASFIEVFDSQIETIGIAKPKAKLRAKPRATDTSMGVVDRKRGSKRHVQQAPEEKETPQKKKKKTTTGKQKTRSSKTGPPRGQAAPQLDPSASVGDGTRISVSRRGVIRNLGQRVSRQNLSTVFGSLRIHEVDGAIQMMTGGGSWSLSGDASGPLTEAARTWLGPDLSDLAIASPSQFTADCTTAALSSPTDVLLSGCSSAMGHRDSVGTAIASSAGHVASPEAQNSRPSETGSHAPLPPPLPPVPLRPQCAQPVPSDVGEPLTEKDIRDMCAYYLDVYESDA